MDTISAVFPKIRALFSIFKTGRGGLPHLPPSRAPDMHKRKWKRTYKKYPCFIIVEALELCWHCETHYIVIYIYTHTTHVLKNTFELLMKISHQYSISHNQVQLKKVLFIEFDAE